MAAVMDSAVQNCAFCSSEARYTCPKCNVQYCSLDCYRGPEHLSCSEEFYRRMIEDELKSNASSGVEAKKKMLDMLKRVEAGEESAPDSGESLDSDDEQDLTVRMEGVDLDDAELVWSRMTKAERERFYDLISRGEVDDIVPPWTPWWERTPVKEVAEGDDVRIPPYIKDCPSILSVPKLSYLTKTPPSAYIPFNVLNVLAAYIWTVRLFNGDHRENCLDATEALLTLSPVLGTRANFQSSLTAIESPKMEAQNYKWLQEGEDFVVALKVDLVKVLQGPSGVPTAYYIEAALSDTHFLLTSGEKAFKASKKPRKRKDNIGLFESSFGGAAQGVEIKKSTVETIKSGVKKLEYFLAFVKEYPDLMRLDVV